MTKIDIFSGFLGAGKTTLIKKLIKEAYKGEKLVLIENEFGTIGIDGEFLKESGVEINELNSGCICCSLVGDFSEALKKVLADFSPDRIIIEPSGVGKLSDVIKAVEGVGADIKINGLATVADANKCKMYIKNFGEFFNDQIENAGCIVLSHTDNISDEKLQNALELIKEHNENAVIITTPWDKLTGDEILLAVERKDTLQEDLKELEHHHHHHHDEGCCCHDHEHHHHDEECCCHDHEHHHHDEECCCHDHEHHHHDEDCCCHDHEHHHHDEDCCCHDHEHHHHDEDCCCHDHEHHHHDEDCCCHDHEHHHHHADDVFTSWGMETVKKYTKDEILNILKELENEEKYGMILRAKGIVQGNSDEWIHFDYIPGEPDVRMGSASVCGRLCVIGSKINEENIKVLFNS